VLSRANTNLHQNLRPGDISPAIRAYLRSASNLLLAGPLATLPADVCTDIRGDARNSIDFLPPFAHAVESANPVAPFEPVHRY
jgi:hypothetical protein